MQWRLILLVGLVMGSATTVEAEDDPYRVSIDLEAPIRSLGADDMFVREPAETLLGALGDQALPALAAALEKEDDDVRIGVVEVLGSLDGEEAASLLVGRAKEDPSVGVRAAAISALISREDPAAAEVVPPALESDDPRLYRIAFDGCARHCNTPEQLDRIVEFALSEPVVMMAGPRGALVRAIAVPRRRASVAAAIERIAGPRLADEDPEARLRAAILFADLEDRRSLASLEMALDHDVSLLVRVQAIIALGSLGDEATVEKLGRSIDSLPPGVRAGGCKALRILDHRGVVGAAAEAVRRQCSGAK